VTFRDPEAARRACADPTPVIDGRRANCNLASLGRPRPPLPYGIVSNSSSSLSMNLAMYRAEVTLHICVIKFNCHVGCH